MDEAHIFLELITITCGVICGGMLSATGVFSG